MIPKASAATILTLSALACSSTGQVASPTAASTDIREARASAQRQSFQWQPWSAESFAKAKRDRKFVLVHGAAEWCHWCHVMEETTYRDPRVGRLLSERFVTIRVDVDARPDIEERYLECGWPATIVLSPSGNELSKYRGYLPANEMLELLRQATSSSPLDIAAQKQSEPALAPRASAPCPGSRCAYSRTWTTTTTTS